MAKQYVSYTGFRNVLESINPLHYYKVLNDSAFVTLDNINEISAILDLGRGTAVNGTQATAVNRPTIANDGTFDYAQFDPSSNPQYWDFGSAGDFDFLHNVSERTVGAVLEVGTTGTAQVLFSGQAGTSSQVGVILEIGDGCKLIAGKGSSGNPLIDVDHEGPVVAAGEKMVITYRSGFLQTSRTTGPGSASATGMDYEVRINGRPVLQGVITNTPASSANAAFALRCGANPSTSAQQFDGRLYEKFYDDRWLPDDVVIGWEKYARDFYGF